MSDQTDQQNEGNQDSQSPLSSASKADENSSALEQEPATPAVGLGVESTPITPSKSLKSLIKVKPTTSNAPPAVKDEALARAMAKMNDAQLDPIVPLETSNSEPAPTSTAASFTPAVSAPSFSAVSKQPTPVPAPTFSAVSAKAAHSALTNTGEVPAFPPSEPAPGEPPEALTSSGEVPKFNAGTSTGDAPIFTPVGTNTGDSPVFGTNTSDVPIFTAVGTNTGDPPKVDAFGTNSVEVPTFVASTSTGDSPAFIANTSTSTGEAPAFNSVGTNTGSEVPTFTPFGTNTGEAPTFNASATATGSEVPTITPFVGTNTGEAPTFNASATSTGGDVPIVPLGTNTGDVPTFVAGATTTGGALPPVEPFGGAHSSSSVPKVIPDSIPQSEFELLEESQPEEIATAIDTPELGSETALSQAQNPESNLPQPNPFAQSVPGAVSAPPAVPRTNAIGLIISEAESSANSESQQNVPSLNPDMSPVAMAASPPAVTSPINAIRNANAPRSDSPIDDDSEWGGDDTFDSQLSSQASDNYESGANKYSLVGKVLFDAYAILDAIGEGSTCKVYSAMKLDTDRLVAIKTPKTQINAAFKQRFADAALKHGKLKHPNIVKSIAYLESPEGQPFFVMEHLAGVTLEEILQTVNRIDDEETLALVLCEIATALEYAHGLEIYHSVLTPRDIVVIESDEQLTVKVLDFQIAEVSDVPKTSKNKKPSSKIYLSPEALRGEESSAQSDIYSLGVIAYRMVTGQFPFDGTIDSERDSEKVADPLAKFNPDLKRVHQLNEVVQEALEADPKWRVETAANFKAAVIEWIETVRTEATGTYPFVELEQIQTGEGGAPEAIPFDAPGVSGEESAPDKVQDEVLPESAAQTKYKRKKLRHVVRTTIHNLVALKQKQQHGEETAGRIFADTVAIKGPRRSPIASMVRLVSTIVVCGGVFLIAAFFLLTNFEGVKSTFGSASRGLSELLPGRKKMQDFEIGEKIVFEKPKPVSDADKKKPKIKPTDIHATPQPFAIPGKDPGTTQAGVNNNLSFGVNNNSSNPKGNRRRVEYRDYVAPK